MKARTIAFLKFFILFTLIRIPIETCIGFISEPDKSLSVLLCEHCKSFISATGLVAWLIAGVLMWLLFVKTNLIIKK